MKNSVKGQGLAGKVLVFQHVDCEGPGIFAQAALKQGFELVILDPSKRLPTAEEMFEARGLIVLGGPMGVYESGRYSWIAAEVERVGEAVRSGKPVIGICLGSQVLASALGARVFPHTRKEIGWDDIELLPGSQQDPLLRDLPSPLEVFHWHGDTFDLPEGAVCLAQSRTCRNQIFRFGAKAWGLQCHLEIERTDPITWSKVYQEEVRKTRAPTVGEDFDRDTDRYWPLLQPVARQVAGRFFGFCSGV